MGENIWKHISGKRFVSKILKELLQLKNEDNFLNRQKKKKIE